MSNIAIRVENIGKLYHIGVAQRHDTLRDALVDAVPRIMRRDKSSDSSNSGQEDTFWALRDVSFEVKRGEVLGVIGRNGAGKSTLLKILSRITEPTEGRIELNGRVGSLLEVGTGFHPELTGRENVYLNGAILGMKRAEIARKFDQIVAFAEIERFLDTPVKRYSSGMYVRLAFAVAAHLEPEILLVDEVLAVGDAQFQKKCLGKMGDVAEEGRTVVFVSHNMTAMQSLCARVIWINDGLIFANGPASEVVRDYLGASSSPDSGEHYWDDPATAPGNEKVRLRAVRFSDENGRVLSQSELDRPVIIEVEYWVLTSDSCLNVSISLYDQEDTYVFSSVSLTDREWYRCPHPPGLFLSRCVIPPMLLNEGTYSVTVLLVEDAQHIRAQVDKIISLHMIDMGTSRFGFFGTWRGVIRPSLEWKTEQLTDCVLSKQDDR